ncbi:MAG: hypothetical protein IPG89_14245 [Bacteroidetes bacterium]|nr:hypothetical protein [Bacteroidota bacterium]
MQAKNFSKYLVLTIGYYIAAFVLLFSLLYFKNKISLISNTTFLNWDAAHYYVVKNNGYDQINTAFFPLFPFFWKLLHLTPIGIGIVNFGIYTLAVSALLNELKLSTLKSFLLLSVPSIYFMFLPYAEAIFFASASIVLIGLRKDSILLCILGLFLCSVSRPTTFIFIPAIVFVYYISFIQGRDRKTIKDTSIKTSIYSFTLILGLLFSFTIQKLYTGKWFTFFESQSNWGNKLSIPTLPIRTWGGDNITRLDASAFFIGICCALTMLLMLFIPKFRDKLKFTKPMLFSIAYLAGATGVVLLYRGGLLFSLNRFIYATPFLLYALGYFISHFSFKLKQVGVLFFTTLVFWLLFNSYTHIHNFLCFAIVSGILVLVSFVNNNNKLIATASVIALIAINNVVAYYLISKHLSGFWVA